MTGAWVGFSRPRTWRDEADELCYCSFYDNHNHHFVSHQGDDPPEEVLDADQNI